MKTYREFVRYFAEEMLANYLDGGNGLDFATLRTVAFIYNKTFSQVNTDVETEFRSVREIHYNAHS